MKHSFLCREGKLSGNLVRNQSSHSEGNILNAEKIPSPDLAFTVRDGLEDSQSEASKLLSRSLTVKNLVGSTNY